MSMMWSVLSSPGASKSLEWELCKEEPSSYFLGGTRLIAKEGAGVFL